MSVMDIYWELCWQNFMCRVFFILCLPTLCCLSILFCTGTFCSREIRWSVIRFPPLFSSQSGSKPLPSSYGIQATLCMSFSYSAAEVLSYTNSNTPLRNVCNHWVLQKGFFLQGLPLPESWVPIFQVGNKHLKFCRVCLSLSKYQKGDFYHKPNYNEYQTTSNNIQDIVELGRKEVKKQDENLKLVGLLLWTVHEASSSKLKRFYQVRAFHICRLNKACPHMHVW